MNKIQYFRELRNLTQEQMADKLNIAVSTYGKIERGETNLVHKQLRKIADIFRSGITSTFTKSNHQSF